MNAEPGDRAHALLGLMLSAALAACGGSDDNGTPASGSLPPAAAPAPSPAPAPTPAPAPAPAPSPNAIQATIQPAATQVLVGQKVLVYADISNTTDKDATWSVQEGAVGGSVAPSSDYTLKDNVQWIYTAPTTPGIYHLIATPHADPLHPATIAMTVQARVAGCAVPAAKVGVWENITPPQIDLSSGSWWGMQAMVVDPKTPSTVYVGRSNDGVYKSLDCGATWVKISTGRNAKVMTTGSTWTMVIDPNNPQVLYTNQGYGDSGVFKTTNGGVDWDQVLTPNITSVAPYGGFIGGIAMDPDPAHSGHLIVSWHAECAPPSTKACYAETTDGGANWTLRNGRADWGGGEGTRFDIINATTRLFSSESNGMWLSKDSGTSWSRVPGVAGAHTGGQIYKTASGKLYMGTASGLIVSTDQGSTWSAVPDSGNLAFGLVGDGTTMYTSRYFPWNAPGVDVFQPYASASEASPTQWKTMPSPAMKNGGPLAYDPVHHILYSSNLNAGMWRVVVR